MPNNLFAELPAVKATLAQGGYANLHCRLPALTASLISPPPTPTRVYRLYREPIVTHLAAEVGVPPKSAYWGWQRTGPITGPVSFDPADIESKKVRIISGKKSVQSDSLTVIDDGGLWNVDQSLLLYSNVTWEEWRYFPPVPGIPMRGASTITTGKTGWDGGGRGRHPVPVGSRVIYRFNRVVALQAGLARPGALYSFATPLFAWYRHEFFLSCTASGAVVAEWPGPVDANDVKHWRFGIHRRGGLIQYIYATGPTAEFTVFHTEPDPGGTMVPVGLPYTVGDVIDALETITFNEIKATLPAARAFLSDSADYGRIRARLPAISAALVVLETNDLAVTLPAVRARLADTQWGAIRARLPAVQTQLRSEPTFTVNLLYSRLPPIKADLRGYTPIDANLNATLPAMRVRIEDTSRGRIAVTLPAVTASLSDYHRDSGIEVLVMGFRSVLTTPLILITAEGLGVGDSADLTLIADLYTAERVELRSRTGMGELVDMLVREGLHAVFANGDLARREALQYAINIATGAPSVYQGFDFNGFVSVDGIAYGWKSDGLYRIGADADDGDTIRALVDFGISDYGRAQRKRIVAAWLGIRTDGRTYVKVRADNGAEHIYRATASRDNHKAVLAKGVAGRRWSFTLELEDASFASLDSIEIEIALLDRRFGGD